MLSSWEQAEDNLTHCSGRKTRGWERKSKKSFDLFSATKLSNQWPLQFLSNTEPGSCTQTRCRTESVQPCTHKYNTVCSQAEHPLLKEVHLVPSWPLNQEGTGFGEVTQAAAPDGRTPYGTIWTGKLYSWQPLHDLVGPAFPPAVWMVSLFSKTPLGSAGCSSHSHSSCLCQAQGLHQLIA